MRVMRLLYGYSIAALGAAAALAVYVDAPDWFGDAIVQACVTVAVSSTMVWLVCEVLIDPPPNPRVARFIAPPGVVLVATPCLCVLVAASIGRRLDVQTWQLMPVFALLCQLAAGVLLAVGGLSFVAATWVRRRFGACSKSSSPERTA